jgi:hypothetical protein
MKDKDYLTQILLSFYTSTEPIDYINFWGGPIFSNIISDVFRKYYKDPYFNEKIQDEIIKLYMVIR